MPVDDTCTSAGAETHVYWTEPLRVAARSTQPGPTACKQPPPQDTRTGTAASTVGQQPRKQPTIIAGPQFESKGWPPGSPYRHLTGASPGWPLDSIRSLLDPVTTGQSRMPVMFVEQAALPCSVLHAARIAPHLVPKTQQTTAPKRRRHPAAATATIIAAAICQLLGHQLTHAASIPVGRDV